MSIPEFQLITWTHQGAIGKSRDTHESIRTALDSHAWPAGVRFDVYLQGSYKNDTNIRADSDVDVVVQLSSWFKPDTSLLSAWEAYLCNTAFTTATYGMDEFREEVLKALRSYYGLLAVSQGRKAIQLVGTSYWLPAHVVVCAQYLRYTRFLSQADQDYLEGIAFYVPAEARWVINYPKHHYENGVYKNARTAGSYKPTMRLFKNARKYLVNNFKITDDLAPSYFLECLLHNVPDACFGTNYQETYCAVLGWLQGAHAAGMYPSFLCQNGIVHLFGASDAQWSVDMAIALVWKLASLWTEF